MDPNATLAIIADKKRPKIERNYACNDLKKWLASGGFDPDWSKYPDAEFYYNMWLDRDQNWV